MKIPKANFNFGDVVFVRQSEYNFPFVGTIIGIRFDPKRDTEIDYTVIDEDGWVFDGYTEDWLTLKEFGG